jgi:hypothetical protein
LLLYHPSQIPDWHKPSVFQPDFARGGVSHGEITVLILTHEYLMSTDKAIEGNTDCMFLDLREAKTTT